MVLVIRWGDFDVIVTLVNGELYGDCRIFGFEDSVFAFEFVNVLAEYLLQEGVGSCLLACSLRSIKYHVLNKINFTGKSFVSAS